MSKNCCIQCKEGFPITRCINPDCYCHKFVSVGEMNKAFAEIVKNISASENDMEKVRLAKDEVLSVIKQK